MNREIWLKRHPYLQSVAHFREQVEMVAAGIPSPRAVVPDWDCYVGDFQAGVPLLHSSEAPIDVRPAGRMVASMIEGLASKPLIHPLAEEVRALVAELLDEQEAPDRAVAWLIHGDNFEPSHPGLLRYLGWTTLARFLSPVVGTFASWRDEERWLRSYCPTCGSLPGMAQLVGHEPGRLRLLSCACCGTRWRYRRTGCPFCASEDDHRLAVVAVEGEGGLRIDYCESCDGYLKTYEGEGNERLLLADWTSLHLDIIARDRGLKRLAASLYEL
ncbi:MAG TPA: formate dehydrogenase accessory protein FdhE [Candidatus Acidoferrum sp.]|nr:formate dehydrogenase accessory protein FdhE [Candidatus Acidoferrum sp.]